MKNQVINQTAVKTQTHLPSQQQFETAFSFKCVVVSELEYDNNTTGQTMTLFNNLTDYETMIIGLDKGFVLQHEVVSVKHTICKMENGTVKPFIFYDRKIFSDQEKITETNGGYAYYLKHKKRTQETFTC
ncbi:hypothetical protein [Flavobacterium sp. RS13.1]|uniref:hypothetical protein n=1 Tax=Flavobacterium sp. RS13.1 TaxID=3400345 RepID=UPI003AB00DD4